jgi:integrase
MSSKKKGAAPKTVNLEVATIRAVLRHCRLWASIGDDVSMLPVRNDAGRALTGDEENRLFDACAKSRSRVLHPFVVLALHTGMRYSELRLLQWNQIDLIGKNVTVGESKTEAGTGRSVPLNERALAMLTAWAQQFPNRKPEHYVFLSEPYGPPKKDGGATIYESTPNASTTSVQEAWQLAKRRAAVKVRLHDLRHTACTRMLEAGIPLTTVGAILGWAGSTMVLMAKRYGHIGQQAKRDAMAVLDRPQPPAKAQDESNTNESNQSQGATTVN